MSNVKCGASRALSSRRAGARGKPAMTRSSSGQATTASSPRSTSRGPAGGRWCSSASRGPGGAVRSEELTLPGLVHDTFATNMNLFLGSPVAAELAGELERHGRRTRRARCRSRTSSRTARRSASTRTASATLAGLRAHDPRDAAGWEALDALYERLAPALFALYGSRLTPRALARLRARAGAGRRSGGLRALARLLVSSTRELADAHLATREAKALLACWGMHLDFGPTSPAARCSRSSRRSPTCAPASRSRAAAPRGCVTRSSACCGRPAASCGCDAEVVRVVVEGGRASAVELADGERIEARRAVIANVTPTVLYGRLLRPDAVAPARAPRGRGLRLRARAR